MIPPLALELALYFLAPVDLFRASLASRGFRDAVAGGCVLPSRAGYDAAARDSARRQLFLTRLLLRGAALLAARPRYSRARAFVLAAAGALAPAADVAAAAAAAAARVDAPVAELRILAAAARASAAADAFVAAAAEGALERGLFALEDIFFEPSLLPPAPRRATFFPATAAERAAAPRAGAAAIAALGDALRADIVARLLPRLQPPAPRAPPRAPPRAASRAAVARALAVDAAARRAALNALAAALSPRVRPVAAHSEWTLEAVVSFSRAAAAVRAPALPIMSAAVLLLVGARAGIPGLRGVNAPGQYVVAARGDAIAADVRAWEREERGAAGGAGDARTWDQEERGAAGDAGVDGGADGGVVFIVGENSVAVVRAAALPPLDGAWVTTLLRRAARNTLGLHGLDGDVPTLSAEPSRAAAAAEPRVAAGFAALALPYAASVAGQCARESVGADGFFLRWWQMAPDLPHDIDSEYLGALNYTRLLGSERWEVPAYDGARGAGDSPADDAVVAAFATLVRAHALARHAAPRGDAASFGSLQPAGGALASAAATEADGAWAVARGFLAGDNAAEASELAARACSRVFDW
jgi:hypothetical protein